jgi:DNA-binding transcriptional regulator YdaS (Cro superfamily)
MTWLSESTWISESDARARLNAKIVALSPGGQQKIADAIGVHNSVISMVASGKRKMTPRIAAYLGLEMELQRVFREAVR